MKKSILVLVILFLVAAVIVVLYLCVPLPGCPAQTRVIEEINRNCDVPFGLAMPETELQNTDNYVKNEGFGGYKLENDDVSFTLAGYPDALSKFHIISYEIKSSKYTLMGLRVGCPLDTAREVMEQNGYTLNDDIYEKSGVGIKTFPNNYVVASFYVFVYTSNIQGGVF